MRLFTAVYPPREALEHLDLALGGVGGGSPTAPAGGPRWVPREQRHVTLAFHGGVPDGAVEDYVAELAAVLEGTAAFELVLVGSGTFGGRTLWVGVGGDVDRLRSLSRDVSAAAAEAGIHGADRAGGRPHLTVARSSGARVGGDRSGGRRGRRGAESAEPVTPFSRWAHALAVYRGPSWPVRTVHVVASRLGAGRSGGPAHDDVAVLPLAGP
ncbi:MULTISPECIES: RNA 2',3'-cyclic phosphodiesterase [unclassified Isoptericola]|uniref:RNA 2',3'-cyclic phosphodiesterase n=1 Tax=unclassified Isoptericola TaxID=2623355 RepID=UPI002712670B|nr:MULTISPECIES: RNA 2',3'-cyclic phosphodiesterase [unclassified Isoptericola]MDO8144705.1 RNA 2',3'-cyclic phosphodiesterase [Isoptericola sp. 178]MDO8148551.1 RNA 2',3'-cyclic phosphodiesterase [Isoptericola sp. b515]MDO8152030.1 RNA 2',3'-cyclic phosphodiesterase [Isoptericola sp. b408]